MSETDDFKDTIKGFARLLAEDARTGAEAATADLAWKYMTATPEAILDVIEHVAIEDSRETPDDTLLEAYLAMFVAGLEIIRFDAESGYEWAIDLADAIRSELLESAEERRISAPLLLQLLNAMIAARLQPGEALTTLLGDAVLDSAAEAPDDDPGAIEDIAESLLPQTGGDEFDIREGLAEATMALPPRFRTALLDVMAKSAKPVLREAAVFSLLDPVPEVRLAACEAIAGNASPALVSGVALRRMIAIRNWLPEAERPHLDAAIAAVRKKGVDCASWPKRLVPEVYATNIDGVGAQSVFTLTKTGSKFSISGLLVKQGVGIADAWCRRNQSKGEARSFFREIQIQTISHKVPHDFVRTLADHYLAVGLGSDTVPGAGLLEFVEAVGMDDCRPAARSPGDLVSMLEAGADLASVDDSAVAGALGSSGFWLADLMFLDSWFEDDAEVDAILSDADPDDFDFVLERVLEPCRAKWTERFLWTALWLKEKRDRQSRWRDFFLVGREMHRGRPLSSVPIMRTIAEMTASARDGFL